MRTNLPKTLLTATCLLLSPGLGAAQELQLSMPLQCKLGVDCFVQNYVDIDPAEPVRAADCGQASYDGHKGTDIRVLNTKVIADVLASAPGIVRALRNDVPDRLMRTKEDRQAVQDKECGNGVVISHQNGWETQYCHLREGSVVVAAGDRVQRGQAIGQVGYSGFAAFAHVHLAVRHNGEIVDPFLGTVEKTRQRAAICEAGATAVTGQGLWRDPVDPLLKHAKGALIEKGLAGGPVGTIELETADVTIAAAKAPALVFYARLINLKKGDRIALKLTGPDGVLAESEGQPLEANKAQWVAYVGRKTRSAGWPAGTYTGEVVLVREGQDIFRETSGHVLSE
ncbi:M23 family metallopeptidase [Roseibium sp. M-1]